MPRENYSIHNLEQARDYFIAMGCSHFHLDRENFQRRDEYYALNISSNLEAKWRQQEVEKRLDIFPFNEPERIGHSYNCLKDIIEYNSYYLERMFTLANHFVDILPPNQIHRVLSVIIGNDSTSAHGGLIEKCVNIGLSDLAQRFIIYAKTLLTKAEDNNISILWLRGYLVDSIKTLGLNEKDTYLNELSKKDNIESFKYYRIGAKEGNIFSMRMLAKHYKEGKGCEIDNTQAIYWLTKAANSGNNLAKNELSQYKSI